ncbi:MAG: Xaa-Pro peptidase family protein [Petrimonas sp.]|jgi:Xaa-Pro aminopeptidase|uniref:M24 family metallopeptidase n=1 Tax=Petrimonas TaxID=307628 RepID=UPI001D4597CC|nr:Xaa-Pro peptidase family protein [Petrimonas sp.]MDD2910204.1 Xaa-Pro peptidase family protein [Petrimonas sp.]MDD4536951.1 Xaa-Pro peptidase family protein [Petrimonas sp.]MDD4845716.1 Xaa-Pro peptidase family protein [Petrimonas sp.]NLU29317.1 aminopeptidase P family protein [Bacteroidales bacterium]
MNTTTIPTSEFKERIRKFQANIKKEGLDACLVHATESDMAFVRYLSEYWPVFETAAVFVPAQGEAILLVGPESDLYASQRSFFKNIEKLIEYRESAEPDAPGMSFITYKDLLEKYDLQHIRKLGIVGWAITPLPVYTSLKEQLPNVEIVKADMTLWPLRFVKSENELACMRKAYQISELAVEAILNEIKPGMTELQVIGIAQREIYKHGGEYEGHSLYCFCGESTNNAISRPGHNTIVENEVIQLNIGARVSGYSSSVGLPFSIGPLPERKRRLIEFGLEAHKKTIGMIAAGKPAGQVVNDYENWVKNQGFGQYLLYGPCHAIGMMEVERPWMESTSEYLLQKNMTFQIDTFFYDKDFGLRWENGVIVKDGGVEMMSSKFMKYIEL